ncbi:MAG: anti-sigma factor family protein [Micromonosporaceae bacterium]
MTPEHPRHGRGVDIDLLADYAGGALDDARERERVDRLVGTDPEWATALEELRAADALVRTDLAMFSGTPAPMPPDVTARIDSALRNLGDEPAPVVSLDAKRRRYRRATAAAVAAGVIGIAGFSWYAVASSGGLTGDESAVNKAPGSATDDNGSDARAGENGATSDPAAPGGAPAAKGPTRYPVPVSASGEDYSRSELTEPPRVEGEKAEGKVRTPRGLERLASPAELRGCLSAISTLYDGQVQNVDYARFEGEPALIVSIRQSGDGERVVVAGPNCRQSDADEKYTATA